MNIIVPIKLVPDLVEELILDEQGKAFDPDWLRLKLNEFDDHAVEQALILQDHGVGQVTVIALEADGVDDVLYTLAARGVDQIIKLTGGFEQSVNNHAVARWLVPILKSLQPGLILTGVQAHNDLDGPLGALLAEYLGIPYVGYVAGVQVNDGSTTIHKEYPGGLVAEMEVYLPAVLGIQVAEQPPRYVAFSKIRQVMKTVSIEERSVTEADTCGGPVIERMFQPESNQKAEMIPGDAGEVAARLVEIFVESGVL
jgi:electron transfer flavoprotein beta subunit